MHFIIIGVSHKTAPVDIRERVGIPQERIEEFLTMLVQNEEIQECMIISTCNRVEVCLVVRHSQKALEVVKKILSQKSGIDTGELESYLYTKEGREAVAHLFRVTASLDSMIVGEPQIAGQIKDAYSSAVASQTTGAFLNKAVHRALHVGKKIRTETGISQHPVSISYAAVLLAEKIFGDLQETRVLLLGAGEMGALAAKHLAERQVGEIWISNRTGEKAAHVAESLGATMIPFETIVQKLHQVDILIASTGASDVILHKESVQEAMRQRKNKPMFFIDIAVPRNIDPTINQIENVYLFDIDHLNGIVEANLKEREKEAKKAEAIIGGEVEAFLEYVHQTNLSPTIQQLSKKFDLIRKNELEKYLSKHPKLSDGEKDAFEGCTRAIVKKILHEPIILMKTEETQEGGTKYSEILKKLFKLEGEG